MSDDEQSNPVRTGELKRLLVASEVAAAGGALESAFSIRDIEEGLPEDATLQCQNEVLVRADRALNTNPANPERGTLRFQDAVETLYSHAEPALAKLARDPNPNLSPDETAALEAIIIADGSRPSFLLNDGKPALDDPFLGTWKPLVHAHWPAIQKIARTVGRVQPAHGHASRFLGTASLIDADKMLILTNYHVIDDARTKAGVAMTQNGRSITVEGQLEIDFIGESESLETNRFRLVSVELPLGFGRGHGGIDAAVARIEPLTPQSKLPSPVPKLSQAVHYANGAVHSLITIGFPGPPPASFGKSGSVDWHFVAKTLFGNKFGLKRMAPGAFISARGSHPLDPKATAFGHNATTFGGASGSLVIAWTDDGAPAFGLHFSGATEISNYALSLAAARDELAEIGVPLG
jgi:hypothetical protein